MRISKPGYNNKLVQNSKLINVMSKNSHKQLYTQTMEWLSTLSSKRKKRVKRSDRIGFDKRK